jgi:hypothetical protein
VAKQQLRDELNRAFTFEKLKMEHELTKLRLELRRKNSMSDSQPSNNDIEWSVAMDANVNNANISADQKSPDEGGKSRRARSRRQSTAAAATPKQSPLASSTVTPGSSTTTIKTTTSPDALFWGPSSVFASKTKKR